MKRGIGEGEFFSFGEELVGRVNFGFRILCFPCNLLCFLHEIVIVGGI